MRTMVFKFENENFPHYLDEEVFQLMSEGYINLRNIFLKLKHPLRKTNAGDKLYHLLIPRYRPKFTKQKNTKQIQSKFK